MRGLNERLEEVQDVKSRSLGVAGWNDRSEAQGAALGLSAWIAATLTA